MNYGLGRSRVAGNNLRKEGELTRNYDGGGVSNVDRFIADIANDWKSYLLTHINRQFPSSIEPLKDSAHQNIHGFQTLNPHVNHMSDSSMNMGYNTYNPASMNMGYNSYNPASMNMSNPQYFEGSSFATTNIYDGINFISGSNLVTSPDQVSTITTCSYDDALSDTEVFNSRAMPPGGFLHPMSRSSVQNFYQPQFHQGQNRSFIGEKQIAYNNDFRKHNFYSNSRRVRQKFQYNPSQLACGTFFPSELDHWSRQHQLQLDNQLKDQSNELLFKSENYSKEANFGLESRKRKHDLVDLSSNESCTNSGTLEDMLRPFLVEDRVSQEVSVSTSQQGLPFKLPSLEEWPTTPEVVTVDSEDTTMITEDAMGSHHKWNVNLDCHEQTSEEYERNINAVLNPKVDTIIIEDDMGSPQKWNLNLDCHEQTSEGYERNTNAVSNPKADTMITEDAMGSHQKWNLNLDCHEKTSKGYERSINAASNPKIGNIITEDAMGSHQKWNLNLDCHDKTSEGYDRDFNAVSNPEVGTIVTEDAMGSHQKLNLILDCHEQTSKGYERSINVATDPKVGTIITEDTMGSHQKGYERNINAVSNPIVDTIITEDAMESHQTWNLNLDCHEQTSEGYERNINVDSDPKVGTIITEGAMGSHQKGNLKLECHEQTSEGYERNIHTTNQEIKPNGNIKKQSASLTDSFTESQIKEHLSSFIPQKKISENTTPSVPQSLCQLCSMEVLPLASTPIYCASCDSRIKKKVGYYRDDTHHSFCMPCFKGCRGANILLINGGSVPKSNLQKKKNNEQNEDKWVQCNTCQLWQHRVCGLYNVEKDKKGEADYICPKCFLKEITDGRHVPLPSTAVLEAKNLPRTDLSDHIEQRLFTRLKQEREETSKILGIESWKVPTAEGLVVRVVSSVDKQLEVKQKFRDILQEEDYPAQFTYRSKFIFLFQRLEGVDVCLFGMCVQEFGSECDGPNNRCVYISYLDSVKFFKPERNASSGESLRTFVYHEILIGYLEHCKKRGFATCYIWACPLIKGEDYIFYCHPETQKTPKQDKLRKWYKLMIKKGVEDEVIVDHTNLYNEFFTATKQGKTKITAARLPYFDGDYWSGAAETIIKNLEQESSGGVHCKLPNKRASSATGHNDPVLESKDALVMKKLGETILPLKENFMIVRLQHMCTCCREVILSQTRWSCNECNKIQLCSRCYDARRMHTCQSGESNQLYEDMLDNVPLDTKGKDEVLVNNLFETRDDFLNKCQESNFQFNTLHHAKYSSTMMLYNIKHKLVVKPNQPSHKQKKSLNKALDALIHTSTCVRAKCSYPKCQIIRELLNHASKCTVKVNNGCKKCQKVWWILKEHAQICTYTHCKVPRCMDIRKYMAGKSKC